MEMVHVSIFSLRMKTTVSRVNEIEAVQVWIQWRLLHVSDFGYQIPIAVDMKSAVFWDVTPCMRKKFNLVSEDQNASIFRVEE
jgi:hypothetical protein